MFRQSDLELVDQFVRLVYEDLTLSRFRRLVPDLINDIVPYDAGNFFHEVDRYQPCVRFDTDLYVARGIPSSAWTQRYTRDFSRLDPIPHLKLLMDGVVCGTVEECVGRKPFRQSNFFNDFLKPLSVYDELFLFLRIGSNHGHAFKVTLMRSFAAPSFTGRDRSIMAMLAPHLCNAIREIARFRVNAEQKWWLEEACRETHIAFLVTDRSCRVHLITDEAKFILRLMNVNGTFNSESTATLELPPELCEFVEALRNDRSASLRRSFGAFAVEGSRIGGRRQRFIIYFKLRETNPEEARTKRAVFQLSPREWHVAELIGEGLANKEIAARMHLSEYTVADHIKHIFRKCGIHSRTELIRLLFVNWGRPS